MHKLISVLILLFSSLLPLTGQEQSILPEITGDKLIKTVQLINPLSPLAPPILLFGNAETKLTLQFDDLSKKMETYGYRILHCNKDWTRSELDPFDVVDGFQEDIISQYKRSFNTKQAYTHYSVNIPNENMQLKVSGNYVIEVFPENYPEMVIIRKRFFILDEKVTISGKAVRTKHPALGRSNQSVEFEINTENISLISPLTDLKVTVQQNRRWDAEVSHLPPKFIKEDMLYWSYDRKLSFPGYKEYRELDLRTLQTMDRHFLKVERFADTPTVYLQPDDVKGIGLYAYRRDLNGNFLIDTKDGNVKETQSEYVNVVFTVPIQYELEDVEFFVSGLFSNYQPHADYKLSFNKKLKAYQAKVYLKQGYYDYMFLEKHANEPKNMLAEIIEGSTYETENEYNLYVYYRPPGKRYDQLIGYKVINSNE